MCIIYYVCLHTYIYIYIYIYIYKTWINQSNDQVAALSALEERSKEFMREKQETRKLELLALAALRTQ